MAFAEQILVIVTTLGTAGLVMHSTSTMIAHADERRLRWQELLARIRRDRGFLTRALQLKACIELAKAHVQAEAEGRKFLLH
jgi:hypothetical protein